MAADELGVHPSLWQMEAQLEAEMVRRNQILGWTVGVILLSLFILGEIGMYLFIVVKFRYSQARIYICV